MAIANVELDELPGFGRRLMELAKEKGIGTPKLLAEELYTKYQGLVNPAQRTNKHGQRVKDKDHDIAAITRMVQKHFFTKEAYKIQSKYLFAYSKMFNCSLDYLAGETEVKSCDLEIRDICKKLHITEKAVANMLDFYSVEPDALSHTSFWSDMLTAEFFREIPEAWMYYSMQVLKRQDLVEKIEAKKRAEEFADEPAAKAKLEIERNTLERLLLRKRNDCEGAYLTLMDTLSEFINGKTKTWVASHSIDSVDEYYADEIQALEILKQVLNDDTRPTAHE